MLRGRFVCRPKWVNLRTVRSPALIEPTSCAGSLTASLPDAVFRARYAALAARLGEGGNGGRKITDLGAAPSDHAYVLAG